MGFGPIIRGSRNFSFHDCIKLKQQGLLYFVTLVVKGRFLPWCREKNCRDSCRVARILNVYMFFVFILYRLILFLTSLKTVISWTRSNVMFVSVLTGKLFTSIGSKPARCPFSLFFYFGQEPQEDNCSDVFVRRPAGSYNWASFKNLFRFQNLICWSHNTPITAGKWSGLWTKKRLICCEHWRVAERLTLVYKYFQLWKGNIRLKFCLQVSKVRSLIGSDLEPKETTRSAQTAPTKRDCCV